MTGSEQNPAVRADKIFANIMAIARRAATLPVLDPGFSEADLYGEDGLPLKGGDFSKTDIRPAP